MAKLDPTGPEVHALIQEESDRAAWNVEIAGWVFDIVSVGLAFTTLERSAGVAASLGAVALERGVNWQIQERTHWLHTLRRFNKRIRKRRT